MPGPTAEPGGPDEFERRIREITGDISGPGVIREPSAAERNRKAAPKSGWRNARKARKLRRPVPSRGPLPSRPPAPPRGPRSSARRRIWSWVIAVVVLAGLAGAVLAISRVAKPGSADNTPVTNGPTPSSSTPAAASLLPSATVAAPFLGTPAQSYANGAAGIVIPPAHAVGRYSAAQVASAYRMTRKLLVAAHLDPNALRGGSPTAFANLLIPQERTHFASQLDIIGLSSDGSQKSTRSWVTSFAPGSTQLVGSVIKVDGTMRATTGMNGPWHVLRIHADYLFVYPVERPGQPLTLTRVVVRYVANDDFAAYDDPGGSLEPWWRLVDWFDAGALCGINDGYVHPQFPRAPPGKVRPTGAPINPYDQGTPLTKNRCQATTGT